MFEDKFLGQYHHNIDEKGRLTIPARFREMLLAQGAFMIQGFDPNIMVLTSPIYEKWADRISQMSVTDPISRLLRRLLYSTAGRIEVDKVGRILIPQYLRDAAGLTDDAVIVGSGEYFEIWSPENWSGQAEALSDSQANAQRFATWNITSE